MDKRVIPPSALEQLQRDLEFLKLRTMGRILEQALETAQKTEQGDITFLAELVQQEKLARLEGATSRRLRAAGFPVVKTFDCFDYVQHFVM